ncbi:MAG: hypothetical protein J6R86_08295 [Lentisphaeria bacterium]|nr:hypothetical protein [Lentisphaeria bacterium]
MKQTLLLSLLFAAAAMYGAVQTNSAALQIENNKLVLKNVQDSPEWQDAALDLTVYDGKSKKFLKAQKVSLAEKNDIITAEYFYPGCKVVLDFSAVNRVILGKGTLINTGKKQLWPEITLTAALSKAPEKFWGGDNVSLDIANEPLVRSGIKGRALKHIASSRQPFPLAAVAGKRHTVYLGHVVYDPVSYNCAAYDPQKKVLSFSQRFVADAGQKIDFTFTAGAAQSKYGIPEGVIQQYYDSFPECWVVNGGQDNPYVWGNQAHYLTWWTEPDFELARRLYVTLEWAYCPYKRSGDIYCRPEFWDYRPLIEFRKNRSASMGGIKFSFGNISRDEFLKLRKDRFLKYGRRAGWMFYNTGGGGFAEYDLLKKHYPDAVNNYDPKAGTIIWNGRWSTHHDKELRAFAYNTSFAKALHEDMAKLTEELKLPGFALDCGSGGFFYRGPVAKMPVPGRAWDEKGVFIDQSVAINSVVDKIHQIKSDIPVTCWVNGTLKGDYLLMERSYVDRSELAKMLPIYRWWIGPRPGSVHKHGYLYPNLVPAWRQQTKAQMMDTLGKLGDYVLLNQFKYGLNNTRTVMYGVPKIVYAQPEAHELVRAGWQIEIPLKLSEKLYSPYLACYGRDENCFLFFGNSSEEPSSGTVTVDSRSIAGNRSRVQLMVRKMRKRGKTVNKVKDGSMSFDITLPARTPVLFETACSLLAPPAEFKAEVSSNKALDKQEFTVKLDAGKAFSSALAVRNIYDFVLQEITVDGKKIAFAPAGRGNLTAEVEFGKNPVIKTVYVSRYFKLTDAQFDSFKFTGKDKKCVFKVFAPGEAAEFASRFDEYFAYCSKNKLIAPGFTRVDRADGSGKGVVTLLLDKKYPSEITMDKNGSLTVTAPNATAMDQLIKKLFYRMDKHYPSAIPMGKNGTMGFYKEQVQHFKAAGMLLPYKPFFE